MYGAICQRTGLLHLVKGVRMRAHGQHISMTRLSTSMLHFIMHNSMRHPSVLCVSASVLVATCPPPGGDETTIVVHSGGVRCFL